MKRYVIALDQGTTSSRCIIFDQECNIICVKQREFAQHFPQDGWVEHDPMEIVSSQLGVLEEAVDAAGISLDDAAGIGITNQREKQGTSDENRLLSACRMQIPQPSGPQ